MTRYVSPLLFALLLALPGSAFAVPGGGNDADGADILPGIPLDSPRSANGVVRPRPDAISMSASGPPPGGSSFPIGVGGRGLVIDVGSVTLDPGSGDITIAVTISGTLDAWGGGAIESVAVDVPVGEWLTFDASLKRRSPAPAGGHGCGEASHEGSSSRDIYQLHIDIPWGEVTDGDNTDDDAGWMKGWHPINGEGSQPTSL